MCIRPSENFPAGAMTLMGPQNRIWPRTHGFDPLRKKLGGKARKIILNTRSPGLRPEPDSGKSCFDESLFLSSLFCLHGLVSGSGLHPETPQVCGSLGAHPRAASFSS